MELEEEENELGQTFESSYIRRLMQILQMPSSSLRDTEVKEEQ